MPRRRRGERGEQGGDGRHSGGGGVPASLSKLGKWKAMRTSALRVVLALLPAAAWGAAVSAAQEMLECECDKVRCGCSKQCSCMQADENTGASFLQTVELAGEGAFLEVEAGGASVQMDRCNCGKTNCNCIKRCECAIKYGGMQAALVQASRRAHPTRRRAPAAARDWQGAPRPPANLAISSPAAAQVKEVNELSAPDNVSGTRGGGEGLVHQQLRLIDTGEGGQPVELAPSEAGEAPRRARHLRMAARSR